MATIYLCGPITETTPEHTQNWREFVCKNIKTGISVIDPNFDQADPVRRSRIPDISDAERIQRQNHGAQILQRNRYYIAQSDLIFANFLGAKDISLGSVGEIFWANAYGKPIIIVREKHGNPHDHDMLNGLAGWIFSSLEDAIEKANILLSPFINLK